MDFYIDPVKQNHSRVRVLFFPYLSVLTCVLGAQKTSQWDVFWVPTTYVFDEK